MIAALLLVVGAALADEGVPEHFVDPESCGSRACTCDDGPMMEIFLADQRAARAAWQSVLDDLDAGTGPTNERDAVAAFQSRFAADSRILDQFRSCAGYDPEVNKPQKIGGIDEDGDPKVDPCYCDAFCEDIVQQTVIHEKKHKPTLLGGFATSLPRLLACKAGALSGYGCDSIWARILTESEVASYDAGIGSLQAGLDRLVDSGSGDTEGECTWDPVVEARVRPAPAPADGLVPRVRQLLGRFVEAL